MQNAAQRKINGVSYMLREGQYYFSLEDTARVLGFGTMSEARRLCREFDDKIRLEDGEAISFNDLLLLSKHSPQLPEEFIDALQEEVLQNRKQEKVAEPKNHPDFSNPAVAARAWAEEYEKRAKLEKELESALEKLGDARDFKIVRAIPWLEEYFGPFKMMPVAVGSYLTRMSRRENVPIRVCLPFGYVKSGARNMYSMEVIKRLKKILDEDVNVLAAYRIKRT